MATDQFIGEALGELLAEHDLSKRQLAKRAGLSSGSALSYIVDGRIQPTIETIERLAKALGVPASHFAEYRLEKLRQAIDWHTEWDSQPAKRRRQLATALRRARDLGLDV